MAEEAGTDRLIIGVWQGRCADGDVEANLARAEQVIDEAGTAGCDFVCLPEAFLSETAVLNLRGGRMSLAVPRVHLRSSPGSSGGLRPQVDYLAARF